MAGLWEICLPIAGQNLITNPSIELGTTGYTAVGGSIARASTYARRGLYSLAVTPTSSSNDGVYYTIALSSGTTYYFSFDFKSYENLPYRAYFANTSGSILSSITTWSAVGYSRWMPTRLVVSFTPSSSTNFRLYITKNGGTNTNIFYVDGWQCEEDRQTTYIDGEQAGCLWNGTPHASTSVRDGQSREGGQLVNFDTFGLAVEAWSGTGAPPINNVIIKYGLQDGGYYQRSKASVRVFQLDGTINVGASTTLNSLHLNRKQLFDAVKVDLVDQPQTFWLRYLGTSTPMWIKCIYEGGLETHYSSKGGFTEKIGGKFVAPNPFFYEEGESSVSLGFTQTVANSAYIIQRTANGAWQALSTGMNGNVYAMTRLPDGGLVAGGNFTTAGGTTVNRVAKWTGSAWQAFGDGLNNTVNALAVDAAGTLYAGGQFTQSGSVSGINRVAKWTGSAWQVVGSPSLGAGEDINTLTFSPTGVLYAGGIGNKVYYLSGSTWTQTSGSMSDDITDIIVTPDGTIYACGYFTSASGSVVGKICMLPPGGTNWEPLGSGFQGEYIRRMAFGPDGKLYACGYAYLYNFVLYECIFVWTGGAWQVLGGGTRGGAVLEMLMDTDANLLYLGGVFTTAGGVTLPDSLAVWSGSQYLPVEVNLPGTANVYSFNLYRDILTVGYDTTGSAVSSVVTVNSNSGTKAYPTFVMKGPGQVWHIKNFTAGKAIYFTDLVLLTGETAILDLTPGNITFTSDWRGNLQYAIAPGSNLAQFSLLPGNNNVSLYMTGTDGNTSAYMKWRNTFWELDGGAV